MDSIKELMEKTKREIYNDLDKILECHPETHDTIDNIKINLAAQETEIKLMVEDKERLRLVKIKQRNRLTKSSDNRVIVFVLGVARRTGTPQQSGKFAVVWGENHELNIVKNNVLSTITRDNTALLGLLACCNQLTQLKIRRVTVMSTNQKMQNIAQNIELIKARNFNKEDGTEEPDSDVLKRLHAIITEHKLDLDFIISRPPDELARTYQTMVETARVMIDN